MTSKVIPFPPAIAAPKDDLHLIGIDDHLAAVGPEMVLDEIAQVDAAGSAWKKGLLRSKPPMNTSEGRIQPVLANAIAAFRHAPEWGGVFAFNEFGFETVVLKPAPWGIVPKGEWTDHEDRLATEWLQRQEKVSVEVAGQVVQTAARDHPFHPVKAYLQGLRNPYGHCGLVVTISSTTRNTANIRNKAETSGVGLGSNVEQTWNSGNRLASSGRLR